MLTLQQGFCVLNRLPTQLVFNSLAPGKCVWLGFLVQVHAIFKFISVANVLSICCEIVLKWMAVFQTKIFFLVAQKCSESFPPYISYYNFYLPRVKFNWSSPTFGRQGRPLVLNTGMACNLVIILNKSTFALVMDWCHYLSQCWLTRFMLPCGVTRPLSKLPDSWTICNG